MSQTINLTIDHTKVGADVTDFPVYVDLANMPAEFWATVQNGGGDIRVYKADGVTELAREVVSCATATDTGELHFKADFISSSTDTTFKIVVDGVASDYAVTDTYGRNAVWPGVSGVYHGNESSGTRANSQGGTSLTETGSVGADIGKLGNSIVQANGTNYLEGADGSTFDITGNLSLSVWVYVTSQPGANVEYPILTKDTGGASQRSYTINYNDSAGTKQLRMGVTRLGSFSSNAVYSRINQTLATDTWTKVRFQFTAANTNTTKIRYFVNGSDLGNGTMIVNNGTVGSIFNSTTPFRVGTYSGITSLAFVGRLDEIRLQASNVSADWETTEYNNQSSPSTFYTAVAEGGGGGPTYTLECEAGSFALTGGSAGLLVGYAITTSGGDFTLSGGDAGILANYTLQAGSGDFALTGGDVGLLMGYRLPLSGGELALTGGDVNFARGYAMTLGGGSFALTGEDLSLQVSYLLPCKVGEFTVTGGDADFARAYLLSLGGGNFALEGTEASLLAGYRLNAHSVDFTLEGGTARILARYSLDLDGGQYELAGGDIETTLGAIMFPFCPTASPFSDSASPFRNYPPGQCG